MSDVFAAAAAALAADVNLGETATWTPAGGAPQTVRAVRSRTDAGFGNAAGLSVMLPAVSLTGSPRRGDTVVLAGTTYAIEDADLDAQGSMWTVVLSVATYAVPGDPGPGVLPPGQIVPPAQRLDTLEPADDIFIITAGNRAATASFQVVTDAAVDAVAPLTDAALAARDQAEIAAATAISGVENLDRTALQLQPEIGAVVDALNRVVLRWAADGTIEGKLGLVQGAGITLSLDPASLRTTVALGTLPATLTYGVTSQDGAWSTTDGELDVVTDAAGRRIRWTAADGSLRGKFGLTQGAGITLTFDAITGQTTVATNGSLSDPISFGGASIEGGWLSLDGELAVFTDQAGRRLATIMPDGRWDITLVNDAGATTTEVTAARGSRSALATRLAEGLTDFGHLRQAVLWPERMRISRYKLLRRRYGESAQLIIGGIGDSWTHAGPRWSWPFADLMRTQYGSAGPGWVGFAFNGSSALRNRCGDSTVDVTYSNTADWTVTYSSGGGPDASQLTSAVVGTQISVTGVPGGLSAARLGWIGAAGAQVRYRWDAGAWTVLDVATAGVNFSSLAGLPGATATLTVEVVAGSPILLGVDLRSAADGVRFHKIAGTGTSASGWAAANATNFLASQTELACDAYTIMHGTNDQLGTVGQYATAMQTIITRLRTARPGCDILIVAPSENGRPYDSGGFPTYQDRFLAPFQLACRELAAANRCAMLDLQYVFGDWSEYGPSGVVPLFNADLIHPEPATGGRVVADAVLRAFTTL